MVEINANIAIPEQGKPAKRVAFVLSGGGSRGALEVGVLLALLERGIRPHILVGTSSGAINAAAVATNPTLEGACWLAETWRKVTREAIMPHGYFSMVWRLVSGKSSLFDNQNLRNFLESHFPPDIRQFADIKSAELYITAVNLDTGKLHVFGIDRSESIIDAIMASTALPLLLSPWQYRGNRYVDGGIISDLPIRVAVEMKATEIYAIDVGYHRKVKRRLRGVLRVIRQSIDAIAYQQFLDELGWASKLPHGNIHYIGVAAFGDLRFWDFSHADEMIEVGNQVGVEYLRQHSLV